MRVLSNLEYEILRLQAIAHPAFFDDLFFYDKKFTKIIGGEKGNHTLFYAQPFKPELITELFEGWKLIGKCHYHNDENCIRIEGENENIYYQGKKTRRWFFPKNLDQFINMCSDAGIELEYKL